MFGCILGLDVKKTHLTAFGRHGHYATDQWGSVRPTTVFKHPQVNQEVWTTTDFEKRTTVNNGYLGSRNDEERSEMRYVMRIAEFRESSNFWTQMALSGYPQEHTSLSVG